MTMTTRGYESPLKPSVRVDRPVVKGVGTILDQVPKFLSEFFISRAHPPTLQLCQNEVEAINLRDLHAHDPVRWFQRLYIES